MQMDDVLHTRNNAVKYFSCKACSKAIRQEDVISARSFRVVDPSGMVKYLVGYRVSCRDNCIVPYYDTPRCVNECVHGDDLCGESCQTCEYAIPYIVGIESGSPKGKSGKRWSKPPKKTVSVTRILYQCTNSLRMEQFNTGTFMSAYIRCKYYSRKEGKLHVQNENE